MPKYKKDMYGRLDDRIEGKEPELDNRHSSRKRKVMIIIKWIIILAFAAGFFLFIFEMMKLGL